MSQVEPKSKTEPQTIKRWALVSVTDKDRLADFCIGLESLGFGILSTGGTADYLRTRNVSVTDVAEFTGFSSCFDGRVKTLHPKIHGGILYDRHKREHCQDALDHGFEAIDLVVVNLYDFSGQALAKSRPLEEAIEFIDCGGPAMLRSAAKNFLHCLPVVDPGDYEGLLQELTSGTVSLDLRKKLAQKVFTATSYYDAMIANYFEATSVPSKSRSQTSEKKPREDDFPPQIVLALEKVNPLRYGENPHQKAAFYKSPIPCMNQMQSLHKATVLQGKEMSYNNYLDVSAAAELVADFAHEPVLVIVKHTNPCGSAIKSRGFLESQESCMASHLFARALSSDPKSAFGGIVATNQTIGKRAALEMADLFLECIAAPMFTDEALAVFSSKKNLRILRLPFLAQQRSQDQNDSLAPTWQWRSVGGGFLVQSGDELVSACDEGTSLNSSQVTGDTIRDLNFSQIVVKHVKSNAIVLAKDGRTLGIGAGQMSRIDAAWFAIHKARELGHELAGAVAASDAFFPFRDTVDLLASAKIKAIIQPGGSLRDQDSIKACEEHGIAMVLTKTRHFRH